MRTILPIAGVPDELIRVLNDRLRELEQSQQPAATSTTLPNVGRPGRYTRVTTDAQGRVIDGGQLQMSDLPGGGYPAGNDAQIAYASGNLTLVFNVWNDVPSATITLNRAGRYLITASVRFECVGAADANIVLAAQLVANGSGQAQQTLYRGPAGSGATTFQQWIYTAGAAGQVVKIQGMKQASTAGTSFITGTHTSIAAVWIGA